MHRRREAGKQAHRSLAFDSDFWRSAFTAVKKFCLVEALYNLYYISYFGSFKYNDPAEVKKPRSKQSIGVGLRAVKLEAFANPWGVLEL